jgi:uncharacterized protein YggE
MSRKGLAVGAAATILLVAQAALRAQDRDSRIPSDGLRRIFVQGTATVALTPDVAELTVGAETRGSNAREALMANNKAMAALMDVLKQQGIGPRDVQTVSLNLSPLYDKPVDQRSDGKPEGPPPKIIGYQISSKVGITVRDIKKIGDLLDAVVQAGINEIENLSFQVDHPQLALRDLRKQAMADARAKAEEIAKEGGMTLGLPISIEVDDSPSASSGQSRSNILPVLRYEKTVPIAVGLKELRVSVSVIYELKPRK